jgi:hypothetical protein
MRPRIHVIHADEALVVGDNVVVLQHEQGEKLMFKRVLLKLQNEETK